MTRSRPVDIAPTSARIRFVTKKLGEGRSATWRVYDLQNGSFPYRTPELGEIAQDLPEKEIEAECERLNAEHGGINEKKRAAQSKAGAPATSRADSQDDD